MNAKRLAAGSAILLVALSAPAARAGYFGEGPNQRQHHEPHRIAQEGCGGEPKGARQATIRDQVWECRSDGVLTDDERRALREDLRIASRNIQKIGQEDEQREQR
jgi:hypothetical protein